VGTFLLDSVWLVLCNSMIECPKRPVLRGHWLLMIGFILLKLPTLTLPIYHDETYVVTAGSEMLHNGFYPITTQAPMWGHPPLAFEIVAMSGILFGPPSWGVHLFSVGLGAVALVFTYLVGKALWGEVAGYIAAAMLAVCPLFFAQAGILHPDLAATTFAIMAIFGLIRGRWVVYILSASLMVLSKETSIILVPLMAGFVWLMGTQLSTSARLKRAALGMLPVLTFALWAAFHKSATGFWWGDPLVAEADKVIVAANLKMGLLKRFAIRSIHVLYSGYNLLLAGIFLAALGKAWQTNRSPSPKDQELKAFLVHSPAEAFIITAILGFLLFHSVFGFLHPRYLLPVFPLLFLLTARSLSYVLGKRAPYFLVVMVPLFVLGWFQPPDKFSAPEASLDYVDIVRAHQAASAYLEQHDSSKTILASNFQAGVNLQTPLYGYVTRPLKVLTIGPEFTLNQVLDLKFDLVYLSSTDQFRREIETVIRGRNLREVRRFEVGRHFVVLYQ
jgi:4-amino-4-deoxy-L-arabinose transferase-like glycosyltransferase